MIEMGVVLYFFKNIDFDEVVEIICFVLIKGFYYINEVMQIICEDFMNKNQLKVKMIQFVEIISWE